MPIATDGAAMALRRILKQPVEEHLQGLPTPQQLERRPVPLSTIKLPAKLRQSEPFPVSNLLSKATGTAGVSPSPAVQLPPQLRQGYVQPVQPKTPPPEKPPTTPPIKQPEVLTAPRLEKRGGLFLPYAWRGKKSKVESAFEAGVGDVMTTSGGTARWLGYDKAGGVLSASGLTLQRGAPLETTGEFDIADLANPDWYLKVVRAIPFSLSLMPLAMAGYYGGAAIATALGLGAIGTSIIGGLAGAALSRPLESAMEAGGAYDDALARNKTVEEAKAEANEVFRGNMVMAGADAFEIAIALAPTPKWVPKALIESGLVRTARVAGKMIIVGLSEGGEELYQDWRTRHARGEEWKLDPVSKEVFAIGAIMGLGGGLGGDVVTSVVERTERALSPSLANQYNVAVNDFRQQGFRLDQSKLRALNTMMQTKEGKSLIERIIGEVATVGREALVSELGAIGKPGKEITPAAKEPWMMTKGEFQQHATLLEKQRVGAKIPTTLGQERYPIKGEWAEITAGWHRQEIQKALAEGKDVPSSVLADYPDLAKQVKPVTPPVAVAPEVTKPTIKTTAFEWNRMSFTERQNFAGKAGLSKNIASNRWVDLSPTQQEILLGKRLALLTAEVVKPAAPEVTIPPTMVEKLSDPEVARKATRQIQDQMQEAVNKGITIETLKKNYVDDLIKQGVEDRLARSMVNIASENVKVTIPTREAGMPEAPAARVTPPAVEVAEAVTPPPVPPQPPVAEVPAPTPQPAPSPQGAVKTVLDQIQFKPEGGTLRQRISNGWRVFNRAMIDDLYAIQKFRDLATAGGLELSMEEDPYIMARLLRGVAGKAQVFLEEGTFGKKFWRIEKGKAVPNFTGESLSVILKEVGTPETLRDFSAYLTSQRSLELTRTGKETGITEDVAQQAIKELEAKYPNFGQLADRLYKYQDNLLAYLNEMGLISNDLLSKLRKYGKYVPFYRVFNELQAKGLMGKKMANLAQPIKRIKGSERQIINPLENIVKNTYVFISLAERNQVGIMMANLVDQNPDLADKFGRVKTPIARVAGVTAKELGIDIEGISEEDAERVVDIFRPAFFTRNDEVTVIIDGKKQYYRVDQELKNALLNLDREQLGTLGKILSLPVRWLRAGAILSPDFAFRNPIRDQWAAFIYSKYGFIPGVDFIRGLASIIGKDTDYQLFRESGAEYAMLVSMDRDYLSKSFQEIVEGKKFTDYVKNPLELLQRISEFGERATRLGEFKAGIRKGVSPVEAAYSAREVTLDFSKAGYVGRAANQIVAFFNPAVQDVSKIIQSHKKHPIRTITKAIVSITIPSILLYLANRDDERWKEIPQWQKDLFWIVFVGDTIWRIPKPFMLGQLYGSMPERFLEWLDTKDPDLMKETLIRFAETSSPGFIPTALLPIIENLSNYNFFRKQPIVSEGRQGLPPELQYTEYTSELAKVMGKLLRQSPAKIDNLLYGYAAGLGRYATEAIDKIMMGTGIVPKKIEPSPTLADLPIIKAFVVRNPIGSVSEAVNKFYEKLEQFEAEEQRLKVLMRLDEPGEYEKYKSKHPELLFAYDYSQNTFYSASARYLRQIASQLSDIRSQQDVIYNSKTMSSTQKRELITELDKLKTDISRKAITLILDPEQASSIEKEFPQPVTKALPEMRLAGILDLVPKYIADSIVANQKVWLSKDLDKLNLDFRNAKLADDKLIRRYITFTGKNKDEQLRIAFRRDHPDIDAALNLWGNMQSVKSPEAADILRSKAAQLGIPENIIPALKPKATAGRTTTRARARAGGIMALGERVMAARR